MFQVTNVAMDDTGIQVTNITIFLRCQGFKLIITFDTRASTVRYYLVLVMAASVLSDAIDCQQNNN